jgi:L-aminopeptidase/D-esterase-like protein
MGIFGPQPVGMMRIIRRRRGLMAAVLFWSAVAGAAPRARDLGVPFDGTPGPLNAITDVSGVEVGETTLIREGDGAARRVRTGVTAIFPRGRDFTGRVFAATHVLNGNGAMTGAAWVNESGALGSPIVLTNTFSVGTARDATIAWFAQRHPGAPLDDACLPVVSETWDGFLNDIGGFHVGRADVFSALDGARGGPVAEGDVGGGTGMIAFGFKGGTGTASRVLGGEDGGYAIGALVQANFGRRENLHVAGVPVGREIPGLQPSRGAPADGAGSIIVVLATDAPLLPHQLRRLAQRAELAVGIVGGRGENSSGDFMIAFSTANAADVSKTSGEARVTLLPNDRLNPLFNAAVQATEEAIINAMVAAKTMTGVDGHIVYALPHDRLRQVLRHHGRLQSPIGQTTEAPHKSRP